MTITALLLAFAPMSTWPLQVEAADAAATQADAPAARIRSRCQSVLDQLVESAVPGASAALVLPDGELVAFVAGVASKDTGEALEPDDRLLVGSTGKSFVTAAVHRLVAEELLDLDARAASYFEGEPAWIDELPNAREVTLRQLLRHESGLPRYVFKQDFFRTLSPDPGRVWKPEELLSFVYEDRPLFAPGEGWAYSDTNYIVLGMLIEEVTGESYYDYVREHFVERFELTNTVAVTGPEVPGIVQGHVVMGREMGIPSRTLAGGVFVYNVQFEWCGGGWASTPGDLARWARILYGGEALEGPYLETLLDGVPAEGLGPGARYGLGAILRDTPAGPAIGHDGFMPGYLTCLAWFPEASVGAALQLNCDEGAAVGRPLVLVLAELAGIAAEELGE